MSKEQQTSDVAKTIVDHFRKHSCRCTCHGASFVADLDCNCCTRCFLCRERIVLDALAAHLADCHP